MVRSLSILAAEAFADTIVAKPRMDIIRSAMHRCPFVHGTAALVSMVTRSIARDWKAASDIISSIPHDSVSASSGTGAGSDAPLRDSAISWNKYAFAGPSALFVAEDISNARMNCLSSEMQGMHA